MEILVNDVEMLSLDVEVPMLKADVIAHDNGNITTELGKLETLTHLIACSTIGRNDAKNSSTKSPPKRACMTRSKKEQKRA